MRTSILTLLSLAVGCSPKLGGCDETAALEVVYTADGTPAFAGQAVMLQSCGGGRFCHAAGIATEERFGAPAGLDFDLNLASTSTALNASQLERLDRDQVRALHARHRILEQVERGLMPPSADRAAIRQALESLPTYERVADDGTTFTPLPGADTDEGAEILRNWLACRLPVIERTVGNAASNPPIGFTVPACERQCVDARWPDIVGRILAPSCALSACHDAEAPAGQLDLSAGEEPDIAELEALRDRLVGRTAEGRFCADSPVAGAPMIVPGDPDGSLLIQKVTPDLLGCGSLMPLGGQLSDQRLCVLRAWVACGACADPEDDACAACQEAARADCGVIIDPDSGAATCEEAVECPRFFVPDA